MIWRGGYIFFPLSRERGPGRRLSMLCSEKGRDIPAYGPAAGGALRPPVPPLPAKRLPGARRGSRSAGLVHGRRLGPWRYPTGFLLFLGAMPPAGKWNELSLGGLCFPPGTMLPSERAIPSSGDAFRPVHFGAHSPYPGGTQGAAPAGIAGAALFAKKSAMDQPAYSAQCSAHFSSRASFWVPSHSQSMVTTPSSSSAG